jgi:hypothetical protein
MEISSTLNTTKTTHKIIVELLTNARTVLHAGDEMQAQIIFRKYRPEGPNADEE